MTKYYEEFFNFPPYLLRYFSFLWGVPFSLEDAEND